jgi:hypothetical protein
MAQLHRDFDAETVDSRDPFEVLPDNTLVTAVLQASEMKTTSKGDGHYLSLEFVVIEGRYEGRKFFDRLNLDNPNEQAVKIAERSLSALCHAAGKLKVSDSDELHGIPVVLKLGIDPAKGEYEARNKVKTYLPVDSGKAAPEKSPTAPKTAPWGKK